MGMDKYRILIKGIVKCREKYLVVEKWYDDRIFDPYQWEFIDGVMGFDETPEKAVQRVVAEKTGITVQVDRPLYTWGFTAGEVCSVGIAFECSAQTEAVVLSEDLNDSKWISKEELSEVITNKAVREDIERAGLTSNFDLDEFGKVDFFVEPME